jgi:thiol-disulfide isomerase/thioredoxin
MNNNIISKNIKELTNNDFKGSNLISYPNKIVLVKFYTTWCGHCKNTISEYNKIADILSDDPVFVIAQINCELYNTGVNSFPLFVIYKNGEIVSKYEDKRDAMHYLNALHNML